MRIWTNCIAVVGIVLLTRLNVVSSTCIIIAMQEFEGMVLKEQLRLRSQVLASRGLDEVRPHYHPARAAWVRRKGRASSVVKHHTMLP